MTEPAIVAPRRRIPERFVSVVDQAVSSLSNFIVVLAVGSLSTGVEFGVFTLAYAVLIFGLGAQRALIGETMIVRYSKMHRLPGVLISAAFGASIVYTVIIALGLGVVAVVIQSPLWAMLACPAATAPPVGSWFTAGGAAKAAPEKAEPPSMTVATILRGALRMGIRRAIRY